MTHVSSKKIKKGRLNQLYNQFGKAFEKSTYNTKANLFLGDFLTKTEKIMFSKRFAVIYFLSKSIPPSYIAESLRMSYTTTYKMSLKYQLGKYSSLLSAIKKDEILLGDILERILRAGLPKKYGRGRWKFLYENK